MKTSTRTRSGSGSIRNIKNNGKNPEENHEETSVKRLTEERNEEVL